MFLIRKNHFRILLIIFGFSITALVTWKIFFFKKSTQCIGCNVVILSVDGMRADHLPCYGYARNTTPNLCAYATKNILLQNAFAQSSWTFANQASLFTGLYPSNHGMNNTIINKIPPYLDTLPKIYKKAGYRTVFVGEINDDKILPSAKPETMFDMVLPITYSDLRTQQKEWAKALGLINTRQPNDPPIFLFIYTRSLLQYKRTYDLTDVYFRFDPTFIAPPITYLFNDSTRLFAMDQLRYNIYKGYDNPQENYAKILELLENAKSIEEAQQAFNMLSPDIKRDINLANFHNYLNPYDPNHLSLAINTYDNQLFEIDKHLKSVFTLLQNPKIANSTIFTFYSDHGENLGEHGQFGHATEPYDTLTHVPLILHFPKISAKLHANIVQVIDLFPTLLRATGLSSSQHNGETNLSILFVGKKLDHPLESFAISELKADHHIASIRTSEWRLMLHQYPDKPDKTELYDMKNNTLEIINVADSHSTVVQTLTNKLKSEIAKYPTYPQTNEPIELTQ